MRSPAVSAVLATVLLTGCGGGAAAPDTNVEEQIGFDAEGAAVRRTQVESAIRDCMRTGGFDYVPVDPAAQKAALVGGANLSDEEFTKQYGDGISTLYEQRRSPNALGGANATIRAALTAPERIAYDRALFGDQVDATFEKALDTGDFSLLGGCTKNAADSVFGGTEVLVSLQGKLDELDQRIIADVRMVKVIADWSQCMRAAGYELPNPDEVDVQLKSALEVIVGPPGGPAKAYEPIALGELQRREVAMVNADKACEEKHIAKVDQEVRGEYEKAFREANAALISRVPALK